jgi:hypothetical protein
MLEDAKSKAALGFLTVVDDRQHGLFGGYLLLNTAGRPLEFHCTAPIRPNRAQEILYGPTLEPFLYGEQIGHTLLSSARATPLVVCTDRLAALAVRDHVTIPVAVVLPVGSPGDHMPDISAEESFSRPPSERTWRLDPSHAIGPSLTEFAVGHNRLAVPASNPRDRQLIADRLAGLTDSFDLTEPFERIREAIQEARRGGQ